MFLSEFFIAENNGTDVIQPTPTGYATEKDDQSILTLADLRKTRLTLGQLNKLRQMNDIKSIEHEQKLKKLSMQYKAPAADAGGM
jgi:hypothetical protein